MLDVVLVDDEQHALNELAWLLGKMDNIRVAGMYTNPLEALKHIKSLSPDLVFLDINMPEISGLTAAQEIVNFNSDIGIIFLTAHDIYAVKAFEINAIDYLLKPTSVERLKLCVDRAVGRRGTQEGVNSEKLSRIQDAPSESPDSRFKKVVVWKDEEILLYDPSEIYFLTSEGGNTYIITTDGKFPVRETLDTWDKKLQSHGFFRSHRSYLVNIHKIRTVNAWIGYTYNIKLDGIKDIIPVSKRSIKAFKEKLGLL